MTYAIALPSGIKMFNWIFTMMNGTIKFEIPMMFAMLFLLSFLIGGLTGVILNVLPLQVIIHDTTWVVSHFHFIVFGGTLAAIVGSLYYYFPYFTGRMLNSKLGWWSFWTFAIGDLLTFGPMAIAGILGMNRRYYQPNTEYLALNQLATIGAGIIGTAVMLFFVNFLYSWAKGPKVGADPWKLAEVTTANVLPDAVPGD